MIGVGDVGLAGRRGCCMKMGWEGVRRHVFCHLCLSKRGRSGGKTIFFEKMWGKLLPGSRSWRTFALADGKTGSVSRCSVSSSLKGFHKPIVEKYKRHRASAAL